VYSNFSTNYGDLDVKPTDDNNVLSQDCVDGTSNCSHEYSNSDHAGSPENFKQFVIGGARGGGGSNFTGSLSGTASCTPTPQT
jgi:hypothetical protein